MKNAVFLNNMHLLWSSFLLVTLLFACKKNKLPYSMKAGHYSVQEIRVYENGDKDTLYYTAVGPNVKQDWSLVFSLNKNSLYVGYGFTLLDYLKSSAITGDGGPNGRWLFALQDYTISETSFYAYSTTTYSPGTPGIFNSHITFTYIE